jgi:hypothetical protein
VSWDWLVQTSRASVIKAKPLEIVYIPYPPRGNLAVVAVAHLLPNPTWIWGYLQQQGSEKRPLPEKEERERIVLLGGSGLLRDLCR